MTDDLALNFFLRMLLGHLVGDFVLQPLWLALAKRAGWRGLLIHVSVVTFATAVMIWGVVNNWWLWAVALFAVHLFIDQFRTFVFTDNSKGKGLLLLILDQTAHVLSIALLSWLATNWQPSSLSQIFNHTLSTESWLIFMFSLIIFAIWVVPILEIETAVAIQSYREPTSKKIVPINLSDRLMGATERLFSITLITFSMGLFTPLAFLPRLYWILKQDKRFNSISIVSKTGMSFVAVLFMGLLL
jgi:hypothetical protein